MKIFIVDWRTKNEVYNFFSLQLSGISPIFCRVLLLPVFFGYVNIRKINAIRLRTNDPYGTTFFVCPCGRVCISFFRPFEFLRWATAEVRLAYFFDYDFMKSLRMHLRQFSALIHRRLTPKAWYCLDTVAKYVIAVSVETRFSERIIWYRFYFPTFSPYR